MVVLNGGTSDRKQEWSDGKVVVGHEPPCTKSGCSTLPRRLESSLRYIDDIPLALVPASTVTLVCSKLKTPDTMSAALEHGRFDLRVSRRS